MKVVSDSNADTSTPASGSKLVAAITENASYKPAEQDIQFLADDAARGLRLQLEYLKPELRLQQHGVDHAIVVFGSTRIEDPEIAERKLATARDALSVKPKDADLQRQYSAAQRAKMSSRYYQIAREFGRLAGRASLTADARERLVIMTGGGPGIMEAVHRGAHDVGAQSVGLNIQLPHEQQPNPFITPELCFSFRYFALRKLHFLHRARALVVFPGGFGTLDELFETLTLIDTGKIERLPVVLVGRPFWQRALDLDFLVNEGVIGADALSLFWYCEEAEEIWSSIASWHRQHGVSLTEKAAERNI